MKKLLLIFPILFLAACSMDSFDKKLIDLFSKGDMGAIASYAIGEEKERLLDLNSREDKSSYTPEGPVVFYQKSIISPGKWELILLDNKKRHVKIQYSKVGDGFQISAIVFSRLN